jgi:hypothetical protein
LDTVKSHPVGQYAIKLYKERGPAKGKKLDRDAIENNPEWGNCVAYLRTCVVNAVMLSVISIGLPFMIELNWKTTIGYWFVLLCSLYIQGVFSQIGPILLQKAGQVKVAFVRETSAKKYLQLKKEQEILRTALFE